MSIEFLNFFQVFSKLSKKRKSPPKRAFVLGILICCNLTDSYRAVGALNVSGYGIIGSPSTGDPIIRFIYSLPLCFRSLIFKGPDSNVIERLGVNLCNAFRDSYTFKAANIQGLTGKSCYPFPSSTLKMLHCVLAVSNSNLNAMCHFSLTAFKIFSPQI